MKDEAWKTAESYINNLLGLSETRGSGNQHDDGDGTGSLYINECKLRTKGAHNIPAKEWEKLKLQANRLNKIPLFTTIRPLHPTGWEYLTTLRSENLASLINGEKEDIQYRLLLSVLESATNKYIGKQLTPATLDKIKIEILELLKPFSPDE
jgi:hypothetical protein